MYRIKFKGLFLTDTDEPFLILSTKSEIMGVHDSEAKDQLTEFKSKKGLRQGKLTSGP